MSLFIPESGLLFWMLLSFGVVFFVLAKFGFPVITRMVEERKRYIDQSLEAAREANEKLAHIQTESESLLKRTKEEQLRILKDAVATRDRIVEEAREIARIERTKLIDEARIQINKEKEQALSEIRRQTAELSLRVAEKVMRKNLETERQHMDMIERLLDEVQISKS